MAQDRSTAPYAPAGPAESVTAPRTVAAAADSKAARLLARLAAGPWPLLGIIVVQALLCLRLVWSNTAFQDEGLYLWAGRLEWAHWLHGGSVPDFPAYFSGAPV